MLKTGWFKASLKHWNGSVVWVPALQLLNGDVALLQAECSSEEDCEAYIRENILGVGELA